MILDLVDYVYINDINNPRQTGIVMSGKYHRQRAAERFWDRMQIIVLKIALRKGLANARAAKR